MSNGEEGSGLAGWLASFGLVRSGRRVPLWTQPLAARTGDTHATRALRHLVGILQGVDAPVLLDLGLLSGSNVTFFGRETSCRLVVNDLYSELDRAARAGYAGGLSAVITGAITQPDASLDGVLCWDVFDYLEPDEAAALAAAIRRVLKPRGVVLAMFSTVMYEAAEFTRYTVEDLDHIRHTPQPAELKQRRIWSSRDVVRLFAPLVPDETYLLKHGEREVLLRKA